MYLSDSHIHSVFSIDGMSSIRDICSSAIKKGIREIAITDHLDYYTGMRTDAMMDCETLYRFLQMYRDEFSEDLIVNLGVEVGQPGLNPSGYEAFLDKYPLDFVIGSVHNFENDLDIYFLNFAEVDCGLILEHYIHSLMELAQGFDFDVCGHITYPLRYMLRDGIMLDTEKYYPLFEELFRVLRDAGKGIELNVSGFCREGHLAMPDMDILKLYRDCGGEIITIGSDSHHFSRVGAPIREGMEYLRSAGFKYVTTFRDRRPVFHSIDDTQ